MARRRDSALDALVDAVALLPWWAGAGLAVLSFFGFQWLSQMRPAPGATAPHVVLTVAASFAFVLRIVVPAGCVIAAVASYVRRRGAKRLADEALARKGAELTDGMSWRDFERLIAEAFRRRGFGVVENGGGGPDGGVDLVLAKDGERALVQCKHWRAAKVGVEVVRELYGVMTARGAARGFVVTSGYFTGAAREFAAGRNVELIDGTGLRRLLADSRDGAALSKDAAAGRSAAVQASPSCPRCKSTMVRRTARQGPNAGRPFWGCSRYPDCHAVVSDA